MYEPLTKYQPVLKGDLVKAIFASGQLAHAQGNYGEASKAYRHALLYLDNHPGRDALAASRILWSLGDTYSAWQKPRRAQYSYKKAKRLLIQEYGADKIAAIWVTETAPPSPSAR